MEEEIDIIIISGDFSIIAEHLATMGHARLGINISSESDLEEIYENRDKAIPF